MVTGNTLFVNSDRAGFVVLIEAHMIIRCRRPPWCTRPTSGWWVIVRYRGKTAGTSTRRPRRRCDASCWITPKARGRQKRGGNFKRVPLNVADVADSWNFEETLSLDEAVCRLETEHPQISEVVRLRFYAGLSIDDTATALGVSPATVKRRWEFGRTWLFKHLNQGDEHD